MALWTRRVDFSFRGWLVLSSFLTVLVLLWTVILAGDLRRPPVRCRPELMQLEARCCAPGQGTSQGRCVGTPEFCPDPYQKTDAGCVLRPRRILISAGSVTLGPTDWDSTEVTRRITYAVEAFYLDHVEVDHARFSECVTAGQCHQPIVNAEPGTPVTNVSSDEAEEFCRFAGGRLPTVAEWVFAAAGRAGRRYPWGSHGLVCRRASYGLSSGPCAAEGVGPDLPGTRPDGATPEGIFDLSGNVAEWALEADGTPSVRGGSFRSKWAGELKTWSEGIAKVADDVGFRCAYEIKTTMGRPSP